MGNAYQSLSRYEEGLKAYEKALELKKKSYGPEHPEVARTLRNMGLVYYRALGWYEEALAVQEKAFKIEEKSLGSGHPAVAITLVNMGYLYGFIDNYQKQKEYCSNALAILLKTYSQGHLLTLLARSNIAEADSNMNNKEEATELFEQLMMDLSKEEILIVPKWRSHIYRIYGEHKQRYKDYGGAKEKLEASLKIMEQGNLLEHPDTALVFRSLAEAENALGEKENAQAHIKKALDIQTSKLPVDHPEIKKTQEIMKKLGV
jgi:tetratricopeptide (TPR) repeat protein